MYMRTNMSKRFIVILFTTIGITLQGVAQIYVPKFDKIVKVISKGVNLREQPNTGSRKLMCSFTDNVFERPGLSKEYEAARADYLLVIDENSEWIHGYALMARGGQVSNIPIYVSKKVCRTKAVQALTEQFIHEVGYGLGGMKPSGKYKGWATILVNRPYIRFAGVVEKGVGFGFPDIDGDQGNFTDEEIPDNNITEALTRGSATTQICVPEPDPIDGEDIYPEYYNTYLLNHRLFKGECVIINK